MNKFFLTILFAVSLYPVSSFAKNMGTKGNGGDEVGLDFQRALLSAISEVHQTQTELFKIVTLKSLEDFALRAKIIVVDEELPGLIEGVRQARVAANDPDTKRIYVHRGRWKDVSEPRLKQALALHELLSLLKVEGTGFYPYSGRYLTRFGINQESMSTGVVRLGEEASPNGARFQTTKCSETTVFTDRKTHEKYMVEADKVEGSVAWRQDGQVFDFSFGGIEFEAVSDRSYVMMTRFKEEFDSLGHLARTIGKRRLAVVVHSRIMDAEAAVDSKYEHLNAEESIVTSSSDGKSTPFQTRSMTRLLEDGQILNVQQVKNIDNPTNPLIVDSQVRTCTSRGRTFSEVKAFYHSAIIKAVQNFDEIIGKVKSLIEQEAECLALAQDCKAISKELAESRVQRDALWFKMIDAKVFLPKPSPPKRSTNRNRSSGVTDSFRERTNEIFEQQRQAREQTSKIDDKPWPPKYRDQHRRPVYEDSFSRFRNDNGFLVSPRDVRDRFGREVCKAVGYRRGC